MRRGEVSTSPPASVQKHLLPCHVRLLDGTDLYIQLPVSLQSDTLKVGFREAVQNMERCFFSVTPLLNIGVLLLKGHI